MLSPYPPKSLFACASKVVLTSSHLKRLLMAGSVVGKQLWRGRGEYERNTCTEGDTITAILGGGLEGTAENRETAGLPYPTVTTLSMVCLGAHPDLASRTGSWLVLTQNMYINTTVLSKSLCMWLAMTSHWTEFGALPLCAYQSSQVCPPRTGERGEELETPALLSTVWVIGESLVGSSGLYVHSTQ